MQTLRYFIYRKIKPSKDAKSGSFQMLLATSSYSQINIFDVPYFHIWFWGIIFLDLSRSLSIFGHYISYSNCASNSTEQRYQFLERINLLVQDFNDVQDQLDVIKEKQKEIALAQRSHGKEIRR
ncbi:hypothetical protein ES319_D06G133400v1, partial [Gossypium barbadense]